MSPDFRAEEGAWQGEQSPCPNYQTYQIEVEGFVRVDIRYQRIFLAKLHSPKHGEYLAH